MAKCACCKPIHQMTAQVQASSKALSSPAFTRGSVTPTCSFSQKLSNLWGFMIPIQHNVTLVEANPYTNDEPTNIATSCVATAADAKQSNMQTKNTVSACVQKTELVHGFLSFSFFLFRGNTRSLRMPALRPASQAGPLHNPRVGTSVVLCDTILMVCVVCSCCATSPYREVCRAKGGIGMERPCAMIFTLLGL